MPRGGWAQAYVKNEGLFVLLPRAHVEAQDIPKNPLSMMRKTLLKDNLGHFLLGQQYLAVTTPAPAHISDLTRFLGFQIPDRINALEESTTKNDRATSQVSMSVCI